MSDNFKACSCWRCTAACKFVPGWFMPGEAEKAADFLGIPLRKFFKKYLGVTFRSRNPKVFALAPRITRMRGGEEYPPDPRGTCIFLKDGKCSIHAVKPYECRSSYHDDTDAIDDARKDMLIKAWEGNQDQVKTLLGRQYPRALDYDQSTGQIVDHNKNEVTK